MSQKIVANVFDIIANRWLEKASDIARMTWTDKVFERWLMWEAYLSLWHRREELYAQVEPHYKAHCINSVSGDGDLVINQPMDGPPKVFLEIGLIIDEIMKSTAGWIANVEKHERDHYKKLPQLRPEIAGLHVIVAVLYDEANQAKLSDMAFWKDATEMHRQLRVPSPTSNSSHHDGVMFVRGWLTTKAECTPAHDSAQESFVTLMSGGAPTACYDPK